MIYELPAGAKTASDIDWTGAVTGVKESPFYRSWYRKNPINEKGDLKSMGKGEGNMVLSYYCRQFTSGNSGNMNARWRRHLGPDWESRNSSKNRRRNRG